MKKWTIKWHKDAVEDLEGIDHSVRQKIFKAVLRLEKDPVRYGEPLGNKLGLDLTGLYKMKVAAGYRVVYHIVEHEVIVTIVTIGKRERYSAYKTASERIVEYRMAANKELDKLSKLMRK